MRDSHCSGALSLSHSSYSAVELIMRDSHLSLTQQLLCSGAQPLSMRDSHTLSHTAVTAVEHYEGTITSLSHRVTLQWSSL